MALYLQGCFAMDEKELQEKIANLIEEVFSNSISLETKELIFRLVNSK